VGEFFGVECNSSDGVLTHH